MSWDVMNQSMVNLLQSIVLLFLCHSHYSVILLITCLKGFDDTLGYYKEDIKFSLAP